MKLRRRLGYLLIFGAAAGVLFSLVGLIQIWRYRPGVTQTVMDTLALFDQTLNTTEDSLAIVGEVLQISSKDVASLQTTIQALASAIQGTNPMFNSLATLTSEDFPNAIDATQTSLASAQSSAKLIDNVLTALTSIPFMPVGTYRPEVPLATSLAEVSSSLNSLTPSLGIISTSLADGKTQLGVVEVELNKISATTNGISTELAGAQTVIAEYQDVTARLKARVEAAQSAAPGWMMTGVWVLSFGLGWLLIAQIGLCAQGLDMLRGRRLGEE